MAAAKPRIRLLLDKMAAIKESCGKARIFCVIPIPSYGAGRCCVEQLRLDNLEDDNIGEIHDAVRGNSKSCLLAAFPWEHYLQPPVGLHR